MDSLGDICGKAFALLLSLAVLAACPARAEQPAQDAPHAPHTQAAR